MHWCSQRITMFLHENITCRLEFRNDYRYFGTQISNILYLIKNSNTFRKIQKWRHVYGDENPRCRSQLLNLTNEPHSVLDRTFVSATGHRKRINIDEDSISFFFKVKKKHACSSPTFSFKERTRSRTPEIG